MTGKYIKDTIVQDAQQIQISLSRCLTASFTSELGITRRFLQIGQDLLFVLYHSSKHFICTLGVQLHVPLYAYVSGSLERQIIQVGFS